MTKKFKRILSVLLAMLTVFSAVPIAGINLALKASAAELQSSGWITDTISYIFDEDTGTLTISGTGDMPDYGWQESPFYEDDSIKSVIIEYGITSIGDCAFENCESLISIEIPDSVTSIGDCAFEECYSLESIEIPDSVTSIGYSVFAYCSSLTSITIPDSVTSIDWVAFYECTALESVIIPASVTSIGESAFESCTSLTSVTIPDSVTNIGYHAFSNCYSLTSITIPDSVTSIGDYAFWDCDSLTSITIPDSVTSIGGSAFDDCDSLTSVTIGNGVTSISVWAFSECGRLTSITVDENNPVYDSRDNCNAIIETATNTLVCGCGNTIIPDSVTSIGDYAFGYCYSLTSVTIPDSVTSIGYAAFSFCHSLTSIEIPDSVISIGEWAFSECDSLTSIEIPDSVTSIGEGAFEYCSGLTSITIPDSVTSIGDWVFYGCNNLADVYYSGTLEQWNAIEIESNNEPLLNANIHFAVIPCDFLEYEIADGKVTITGCNDLTPAELVIPSEIERYPVTKIGNDAFWQCDRITGVVIPDTVKVIDNGAFGSCNKLKTVKMSANVESIGEEAFAGCCLDSLELPKTLKSIGVGAFSAPQPISIDYKALVEYAVENEMAELEEGDTVDKLAEGLEKELEGESISEIAGFLSQLYPVGIFVDFAPTKITIDNDNPYLCNDSQGIIYNKNKTKVIMATGMQEEYTLPDSVTEIEAYAFGLAVKMRSIKLPEGLNTISEGVFTNCTGLTEFTVPDSITSIGDFSFEGCENLASVTIPDSVTTIGDCAFNLCDRLTDVYYSGTQEQWNDIEMGIKNEKLLNATIRRICTVTLNPQGGSVTPSSVQVEAGESAALPEATRTGFTFLGWSADSSAKTGKMTYKPAGDTTLYAIWKLDSGKLDDSDFYSFANTAAGFGCDTYTVSDGDFEKLAGYVMTQYGESSEITKNTISMLRSEKDKPWRGSCYGMAAAIMLDKLGRIGFNENFDTDAPAMYDVDSPIDNPDVLSAINYYQLSQFLGFIKPNISFSRSRNWTGGLRNLVQLSKQDSGFMFIYNYEDDGSTLAHAIIIRGYAAEDDSFYYLNAYDSRSPAQDITVQVAKDYSDCAVLGENSTEEPVQIELMTEFSGFDAVDIDGPDNDMILKPEVSAIISDSTVLSVLAFGDVTITNADGETITVSDGDVSGTMNIISDKIIVNNSENGAPASAALSFEVADSEYFNFESTAENMSVSVLNGSIYASVETKNADSIVIAQDEGVSIDGENAEYKVCLTLDDDYCDMIKLEGTADNGVDISFKDNGVEISGVQNDTCRLTSYSGLTDEEKFEFSADDSEIIITSGKTGIDVLSKDANGAYTASLINKLKVKVNGLNLMHKEEGRIRTIITNADAKKCSYAYSSSNPGVAEVDNEGNITTKAPGKTTITCIVADENGRTAESTCTVKVKFTFWQWIIWLLFLGFLRL